MAGLAILAATAMTMWAGEQDFTLVNRTGFTISALYVAPERDRDWGEDILVPLHSDSAQSRQKK
jgi:hypothetical protein